MKNTSGLWVSALFVLAMLYLYGTAEAQTLSVRLASDGTQDLTTGSNFSNGGTITVTASGVPSGLTIAIASVTLSASNASIFSSLTLNGSAPGGSSDASLPLTSGSNPAGFSNIQLSDGQSATFTLGGTMTSTPPAANTLGRRGLSNFKLASLLAPGPGGSTSMIVLGVFTLTVLAIGGKLRRRHLIIFAAWAVMAAAVAGCGNGGSASSDQQITAVSATSSSGAAVNVIGTPVDMGTITLEINQVNSGGVLLPTPAPMAGIQGNAPGFAPAQTGIVGQLHPSNH